MIVGTHTLSTGNNVPSLGLGTWRLGGETVKESVRAALDAGYRHIDTAEGYRNESEVGEALEGIDREDVFITSKVLAKHLNYDSVIEACRDSLERLGTTYLDLYLIHWPNPAISLRETLAAMETLHDRGLVSNIGVSNFSAYQLSCAHHLSDVPIAVNQIEFHPWFQRPELVDYCRETDTVVEAAAPLARTEIFEDPCVRELARKYDRSAAQVVLNWALERDVVVLPRSSSPEHVRQNADLDWTITDADLEALDGRDRNQPIYDTPARDWTDDVYGIQQ